MTADESTRGAEASFPDDPEVREALAGGDRASVHGVVEGHPSSLLAWTELADLADSENRPVEAFAYATVAVEFAREQLGEGGWLPGGNVLWSDERNRPYLRALDAKRRAAQKLGLDERARRLSNDLSSADATAPDRIASEFVPTQQMSIDDIRAEADAPSAERTVTGER